MMNFKKNKERKKSDMIEWDDMIADCTGFVQIEAFKLFKNNIFELMN
jgi:hypothetical protein